MNHLDVIRSLPCILCKLLGMVQTSPTAAHHIREGQGGAQRADDMLAIPLCDCGCHRGPRGIHGDRTLLILAKVDELGLLSLTFRDVLLLPRGTDIVPFDHTAPIQRLTTSTRIKAPKRPVQRAKKRQIEREVSALTSSKVMKHTGEYRP